MVQSPFFMVTSAFFGAGPTCGVRGIFSSLAQHCWFWGNPGGRMTWDLNWLVVSTHLKNMKVSWDDHSQYMEKKKCSKPPPRSSHAVFYVWFVAPLLSSCWRGLPLPWPNSRDCPTNGVEMGGVPQITRYGQYSSEHDCPSRLDFRPTFQILPSELLKLIGVCTP